MKSREIVVPILNDEYKVIVLVTDKPSYMYKQLKAWRYNLTQEEVNRRIDGLRGVCFYKKGRHPVIGVSNLDKDGVATLAHEACHAVEFIFSSIGETSREEIFAHSVGAIVRKVLK